MFCSTCIFYNCVSNDVKLTPPSRAIRKREAVLSATRLREALATCYTLTDQKDRGSQPLGEAHALHTSVRRVCSPILLAPDTRALASYVADRRWALWTALFFLGRIGGVIGLTIGRSVGGLKQIDWKTQPCSRPTMLPPLHP